MRALFIFNDWTMDLSGYDLIVCGHNYDPASLRMRPDVGADTKLAAYVCFDSVMATPFGTGATTSRRIYNRMVKARHLKMEPVNYGPGHAPGFVLGEKRGYFFSSYPWPKSTDTERENRWDHSLTFGRVRAQAQTFAHEISNGWDLFYVDGCRPIPDHIIDRYREAGFPGFEPKDRDFVKIRSEYLLRAFLAYLRSMRKEPILGNSAGWVAPELDGICIEWGAQEPWRPGGLKQIEVMQRFSLQREFCSHNGRGCWSVDFAERFDVKGLAMRGVIHGNRPAAMEMPSGEKGETA